MSVPGVDGIRDEMTRAALKSLSGQVDGVSGRLNSLNPTQTTVFNISIGSDVFQIFTSPVEPTCPQSFAIWVNTMGVLGSAVYLSQQQVGSGVWDWTYWGGTASVI